MNQLISVIVWAAAAACTPAMAQCYEWVDDPDLSATDSDTLTQAIAWDPDGAGPEPELLVVCGDIRLPGSTQRVNIAAWDGVTYRPLGSGLNRSPRSLAILEGRLIAAGDFTASGATPLSGLASFGADGWQQYGPPAQGGTISSISAAPQRNLLVVGTFTSAAGVAIPSGIALLKDGVWEALPMAGNQIQTGQQAIAREGNDPYIYVGPYGFTGHLYKLDFAQRTQWERLVTEYPYPTHVRLKPDGTLGSLTWWNLGHTHYSWIQTYDGTRWISNTGPLLSQYATMDWAQSGGVIGSTLYTHYDPPSLAIQAANSNVVLTPVWSDAARVLLWRGRVTAVGSFQQTPDGPLGPIATAQSDGKWTGLPSGARLQSAEALDDAVIGFMTLSQPGGSGGYNHAQLRYRNGIWAPLPTGVTFLLASQAAGQWHYVSGYAPSSPTAGAWTVKAAGPEGVYSQVLAGQYALSMVGDEAIASEYVDASVARSYLLRGRTATGLNNGFTGVIRAAARWNGADYVVGDRLTVMGIPTPLARHTPTGWEALPLPVPGTPAGLIAGSQELYIRMRSPDGLYAMNATGIRQVTPPGLAGASFVSIGVAMEQLFYVGAGSTSTTGLLEFQGGTWRAVPGGETVLSFSSAGSSLVTMGADTPTDNGLRRLRRLVTNCPADFNCDGGIEGADLESFFTMWTSGSSIADINQDGGVDFGDVAAFIEVWEAGGC